MAQPTLAVYSWCLNGPFWDVDMARPTLVTYFLCFLDAVDTRGDRNDWHRTRPPQTQQQAPLHRLTREPCMTTATKMGPNWSASALAPMQATPSRLHFSACFALRFRS